MTYRTDEFNIKFKNSPVDALSASEDPRTIFKGERSKETWGQGMEGGGSIRKKKRENEGDWLKICVMAVEEKDGLDVPGYVHRKMCDANPFIVFD